MAKQTAVVEEKPGLFKRVQTFYEEVMAELKKVTWPTREDLKASTKVTLFLIAILAILIYSFDQVLIVLVSFLLRTAA